MPPDANSRPIAPSDFTRGQFILFLIYRAGRSIAAGMITIAFPYLILSQYHYSPLTLGLIYTSAAVATAAFGLAVGFLADIWGRKRTLALVGVTLPLSSAMAYYGHSLGWFYAAAIVGGYSATGSLMGGGVGGASQPIQSAIIASVARSEKRTLYFSIFTFLSGIFSAAGALLARPFSVHWLFLIATVVAAIGLLPLVWFAVPEVRSPPAGEERRKTARMKSKLTIGKFSITGMLNGFSQGLVTPFMIPFFVLVYHLPKDRMAAWGFAAGVAGSFSMLASPLLDRKLGFVRAIALTRGLGALLMIMLPLWHWLPAALGIYIVMPALRLVALPAQQRAITDMVDSAETGRALGINQVTRLGASSGAVTLTGYLFSASEFAAPFFIYAGVMAANIGLYFKFFGSAKQQFAGNVVGEAEG